ncbi:hypothetical protein [Halobellus rufus]|uniref:hypothetical protein n=1 Tax=Halobellus rufus TaxID=1448860 RepID=UPI000679CA33|nr:hypothetical protein [Halobellus rufus]
MSASSDPVRYATAEAVIQAGMDIDPSTAAAHLTDHAKRKAAAATQSWINRTGRPFHAVRVGATDEPRSWEVHDVQHAISWHPATVILDNARPMPLDPAEGDAIEIRESRDSWADVTDEEGDAWTMDYRRRRLRVFERRLGVRPYDDPNTSFVRLTYRYGPLGEEVEITEDNVVESVPPDVREAVAAKAAMKLALDDDAAASIPDDGQLTSRSTKRQALKETWENTTADYSGFSTI